MTDTFVDPAWCSVTSPWGEADEPYREEPSARRGTDRGRLPPGALGGEYAGPTAQGTVGVGANVLLGGSSNQITLQPVSVEGSVGLNAAAGVAAMSLRKAP